ncbi:glycosyltransferase family 2 protein [Candidatus Undinarchaeota archaeon]
MLSVVIPAYNEEKSLGAVLKELNTELKSAKIIVVDDGSKDKTYEIAKKYKTIVCRHVINRGLGATLATGIECALKEGADIIVTFDADLQHEAKDILRLIEPIKKEKADAVIGSRFLLKEHIELMPYIKRFGNWVLTWITNVLAGSNITDSQSGLRAFDRKAAKRLMILCDRYEVSSEIVHELRRHKLKVVEVPIKAIYDERSKVKGTTVKSGFQIFWGLLLKQWGIKK